MGRIRNFRLWGLYMGSSLGEWLVVELTGTVFGGIGVSVLDVAMFWRIGTYVEIYS